MGSWSNITTYHANEGVTYNGSYYGALRTGTNFQPDLYPLYWKLYVAKGAKGDQGDQGAVGVNFRGTWSVTALYNQNDLVSYAGSAFVAFNSNTGHVPTEPNSIYWGLLVAGGSGGGSAI